MRNAYVTGWRRYKIGFCRKAGSSIYSTPSCAAQTMKPVLVGQKGHHFHGNPASPAECLAFIPCSSSIPGENCKDEYGCGYYGLFIPSEYDWEFPVWAQVIALGKTLLCYEKDSQGNQEALGFRCDQYSIQALFWPRDETDRPLPDSAQMNYGDIRANAVRDIAERLEIKLQTTSPHEHMKWGGFQFYE